MEITLAEELLRLRKLSKLTLKEVEIKTEIPNGYLSMLENGKIKNPQANRLAKLCLLYKVDFESLFKLCE